MTRPCSSLQKFDALLQTFCEIVAVFSNSCYKLSNVHFLMKITSKIIIHKWCKWLFIRKYLVAMNHETLPNAYKISIQLHMNFQFFSAVLSLIDCYKLPSPNFSCISINFLFFLTFFSLNYWKKKIEKTREVKLTPWQNEYIFSRFPSEAYRCDDI